MNINVNETNDDRYTILSDEDLILLAKDSDYEAFDTFHQRYLKKILNYVNRMICDYQKAEEITQETFLQVYRNLDRFVPCGKVSSWVFKIATNLTKNELRAQKRKNIFGLSLYKKIISDDQETELIEVIPDKTDKPDNIAQHKELSEILESAIKSLPKKYREVMLICEVYGYTYQEASEILACSKANIGIRLCRARRKMQKILASMNGRLPHILDIAERKA